MAKWLIEETEEIEKRHRRKRYALYETENGDETVERENEIEERDDERFNWKRLELLFRKDYFN